MQRLSSPLAAVVKRELAQWRQRPFFPLLLLCYPLAVFALLAWTFAPGVPEQLPVGVVDLDRTDMSRALARAIDATSGVAVTARAGDIDTLRDQLFRGAIYAVVVLPADLERDALAGRQPGVAIYYDNQHQTAGSNANAAIRAAIATQAQLLSADLLRQSGANVGPVSLNPVQSVSEVLFNPQRNYTYFLLTSLLPAVFQLFVVIAGVYAVGLEFKRRTQQEWLATANGSASKAIAGKLAPYFLLLTCVALLLLVFEVAVLDVPLRGSVVALAGATSLFVLAVLSSGALIAVVASSELSRALALATLYVSPTFAYSGTSFPVYAMPQFAQAYREILPLSSYLEIVVDQMIRGAAPIYSLASSVQLAAMASVFASLAILLFRRRARTPS